MFTKWRAALVSSLVGIMGWSWCFQESWELLGNAGQGDGGALSLSWPVLNTISGAYALLGCLLYIASTVSGSILKIIKKTW